MKNLKTIYITILISVISVNTNFSQTLDLATVKNEVKQAIAKEQNAFITGNCDTVLNLMDENITFLANGRKASSKEMIGKFCNSIQRPFKTPLADVTDIYPLTSNAAYTIRTLSYQKNDTTRIQEYVTKIWKKIDGQWKITHLHSTVKDSN